MKYCNIFTKGFILALRRLNFNNKPSMYLTNKFMKKIANLIRMFEWIIQFHLFP